MAQPSRASPLFDQIYEFLWSRIISGDIVPGTRLSDLDWSARLDVSRTPVREAMRKLQQDGVLVPLSRGGYELRHIGTEDLLSLYSCRGALEALAARQAALNASEEEIAALEEIIETSKKALAAHDFAGMFDLNTQFHDKIVAASRNIYLERILKDLRRMILFARSSLMSATNTAHQSQPYMEHLQRVLTDHMEVLDRISARDLDGAYKRMEEHIDATIRDMIQLSGMVGETEAVA